MVLQPPNHSQLSLHFRAVPKPDYFGGQIGASGVGAGFSPRAGITGAGIDGSLPPTGTIVVGAGAGSGSRTTPGASTGACVNGLSSSGGGGGNMPCEIGFTCGIVVGTAGALDEPYWL